MAQIATYEEIDRYWSINTLADAHEALDLKEEAELFYNKNN